jgi:hypothetical protein
VSRSVHQLVRTQILFREVNERLLEAVGAWGGPLEFLCECSRDGCIDTIPLELATYERVRADPNLFIVVDGHEDPDVDHVVDQGSGYLLVAKTVEVESVLRTDPRSPDERDR